MNKYKCFYKNKTIEVEAETTFNAQKLAQSFFKAKKAWEVSVILVEKDGKEIIQSTLI